MQVERNTKQIHLFLLPRRSLPYPKITTKKHIRNNKPRQTVKQCKLGKIFFLAPCIFPINNYICDVFFMVLDLRLIVKPAVVRLPA